MLSIFFYFYLLNHQTFGGCMLNLDLLYAKINSHCPSESITHIKFIKIIYKKIEKDGEKFEPKEGE